MKWASTAAGRQTATPKAQGACPVCGGDVLAKCGTTNVWHWAHRAADCDPWSEPETEWHREWKSNFPPECQEVVIGNHRADVCVGGVVVEFQHSPISAEEIREREAFYGNMMWVVDASAFGLNLDLRRKLGTALSDTYRTFRWKWPRRSWGAAFRPLYLDFGAGLTTETWSQSWSGEWKRETHPAIDGEGLFKIGKMYVDGYCGGWGNMVSKAAFIAEATLPGASVRAPRRSQS